MTTIENSVLKVSIDAKGAQMTSLYDKENNIEHLWQADPNIWGWHAPNLFPVIGRVINDELLVDGKTYPMQKHGFARHSAFKLAAETTKLHALFSLQYNDETLKAYPYKFNLQIIYDLIDNALRVTYKIVNLDDKAIYFDIGGHPAFNVPFKKGETYEDYYLEFETAEKLETHTLNTDGYFSGKTEPVKMDGNKLYLNKHLFDNDALVFKNTNTRQITIKSSKHDKALSVEFPHFNYVGIWAKPGADYVCIEPWLGCADTEGKPKDIAEREDIQRLEKGHVYEASFYVSI